MKGEDNVADKEYKIREKNWLSNSYYLSQNEKYLVRNYEHIHILAISQNIYPIA